MPYCGECGLSFSEAVDEGYLDVDNDSVCPDCGGEWVNVFEDDDEESSTMAHDQAKNKARIAFDGRCIFRGTKGTDPMHFYPAGDYKLLADVDYNIFPGSRHLHSTPGAPCFDWSLNAAGVYVVRSIAERLWILLNLTKTELRPMVVYRLGRLKIICGAFGIPWPAPEAPGDLHELLCGFKVRRERQYAMAAHGIAEVGEIQRDL